MENHADIVVFGTGSFSGRIILDIAATASKPVHVVIAGRNAARIAWLRVAANARAALFQRPATFAGHLVDLASPDAAAEVIGQYRPTVLVQGASAQPAGLIGTAGDGWSALVAQGGLSATAVFQALISTRVAKALAKVHPSCNLINCCFPDVTNPLIAAAGLKVTAGMGNVAILAAVFSGELGIRTTGSIKVLAHYQNLAPWRRLPETRTEPPPRVWQDGKEIRDVYERFRGVKLTPEPVVEISGASGVPFMLAMAGGHEWLGHVPGPNGLPGGYPVAWRGDRLEIDLPPGLSFEDAVSFNTRWEEEKGLAVGPGGKARYTGKLYECIKRESPTLAEGFYMADLEDVYLEMSDIRTRLQARKA